MGPGGQREESELTCGPGLSARGRERLRGDTGCCGERVARAGLLCCAGSGQLGRGGCLLGWRVLRTRDWRWGPVEGAVGRARPRGEKGGSWPCGRRGELGRGAGSAREKGGENGLGQFGLRLSLGWRRKEVAGWAAHGFGAGLAVGLVWNGLGL